LYVLRFHPGLSGFQEWDRYEYSIVLGCKAKNCRPSLVGEFEPPPGAFYRVNDGHLPEYCPVAGQWDAVAWLRQNPYQCLTLLESDKITPAVPGCCQGKAVARG
jgi:hypothetical protein